MLKLMEKDEVNNVVSLIERIMNKEEGEFALKSMNFHFSVLKAGLDDGRLYYIWYNNGKMCGLVGLHHYDWGPTENVWLSWFGIAKKMRRKGFGTELIENIEKIAMQKGYKKLFIETYSSPDFDNARIFYRKMNYKMIGLVPFYMSDNSAMVVYYKSLGR